MPQFLTIESPNLKLPELCHDMGVTFQHCLRFIMAAAMVAICSMDLCAENRLDEERRLHLRNQVEIPGVKVDQTGNLNQIEHLVFGMTPGNAQLQIEHKLSDRLYELRSEYDLTDAQASKLKLAARIEVKQFFSEVDELRRQYDAATNLETRESLAQIEARELKKRWKTLFGSGSFLAKVTERTVTEEQREKHHQVVAERLRLRHRSNIEGAIRDIERHVVLSIDEHESLVKLLTDEIKPPRSFGDFDEALVRYQLSQLSEQKIKPLLAADHWPTVCHVLDAYHKLKPLLSRQGLLIAETIAPLSPEDATEKPQGDVAKGTLHLVAPTVTKTSSGQTSGPFQIKE